MFTNRLSRPSLEPLEDRSLLSCTVFAERDTLFIQGDVTHDSFKLTAHQAQVTVICNGGPAMTFAGITAIVADLGAGNDSFEMTRVLEPIPQPWSPFALGLTMGAGGDVANIEWSAGGEDSIWVDMGDGNDSF